MAISMNETFESSLKRMNKIKDQAHTIYALLSILRAAAVGAVVTALWTDVIPEKPLLHLVTGIVSFIAIIRFSSLSRRHRISADSMLIGLDMQHPAASVSPFTAAVTEDADQDWLPRLQREEKRLRAWEYRRLTTLAGSLLVPTLLAALLISKAPPNISIALGDVKNVLTALTGGTTLEVIEGAAPSKEKGKAPTTSFSLSTLSPPTIELIPSNMLKLTIVRVDASETPPSISLQSKDSSAPLTIQMSTAGSRGQGGNIWSAEFSAAETSDLIVPSISAKPLALLQVQELPIPKVQLSLEGGSKDPWPDHEFLPLSIQVTSVHPLDKVRLNITAKGKTSQESVLNISGTTTTVTTSYKLNLQPWMEEDIVEFDIVAEAIDRADPSPLVGKSPPLHIKVASAYGRYKNSLETLKKVKSLLDDSRSNGSPFPKDTLPIMQSALQQSENTPFFDGIDRGELGRLQQKLIEASNQANLPKTQELSDDLGNFLLEHEILNDRERDRDFFIAIRSFSRVLDLKNPERINQAQYLSSRMTGFLDERQRRWTLRIQRLGAGHEPSSWNRVHKEKPFHRSVKDAGADADANPKRAQGHLSKVASEYRAWIEELEAKEDQLRAKMEQERQQGLANARNDLKEIQQRQDQISSNLDRANQQAADEMAQKWPPSRQNENSNVKQSGALLNKLRALSPTAGERLEAAIQSMSGTLEKGEAGNWPEAEAASDLAGRLLRDADQAASKSQKQQDRGRRRKTGGDDYHGTSIGGQVEIKSEYRVDPRYREEILRDVESEMGSEENKNILDGWLRQVVR